MLTIQFKQMQACHLQSKGNRRFKGSTTPSCRKRGRFNFRWRWPPPTRSKSKQNKACWVVFRCRFWLRIWSRFIDNRKHSCIGYFLLQLKGECPAYQGIIGVGLSRVQFWLMMFLHHYRSLSCCSLMIVRAHGNDGLCLEKGWNHSL